MNGKELTRTPKGHGFPSGCHPPHPQRSPQRSAAGSGRCEHERKWNHFIRHNLTLFARCDEEHHTDVGETPVASPPLARISVRACRRSCPGRRTPALPRPPHHHHPSCQRTIHAPVTRSWSHGLFGQRNLLMRHMLNCHSHTPMPPTRAALSGRPVQINGAAEGKGTG
jgi:hypothetical protein